MKINKEITHVEIVNSVEKLNQKLENGYVLIEVLKRQDKEPNGYFEYAEFIIGC